MRRWLAAGVCVIAAAAAAGAALGAGGAPAPVPDTIVHNGVITTMDGRGTTVQALAIRDGEIVAAGDNGEIEGLAGDDTRRIDLGGRRVLPGLIDAHLPAASMPCFSRTPRFDAIYRRNDALLDVADRAARSPAGRWLFQLGASWNVAQLDVPGMPTRAELDAIAPNHAVYLEAAGFRGAQLNGFAMRALGLRAGSPGVALDASGRATGQVTGAARRRARRAVSRELEALTAAERETCTRDLVRELSRRGLTAWDDPGGGDAAAIARLHRAGELGARVRLNLRCAGAALDACLDQLGEIGDETLRIGGISGVLEPGARGVHPPARYAAILRRLAAGGWSLEHGATGATTQHGMVEQWERVNLRRPITDLRWRMLHPGGGPAEPNADALARLRELNAGVVPTHAAVKGGRSHPPYRRIHASGTRACLGTGATYPPFLGLWYAVSGTIDIPNRGGVAPGERVTREQALELATRRCGWFLSLDDRIGSLEVGRLADLIVLSDDYFRVPVDRIRTLTSLLTLVGGRAVHAEGPYEALAP